jgi:hypothetical protein
VPASAPAGALKQIRELQRLLRASTVEVEDLREAVVHRREEK